MTDQLLTRVCFLAQCSAAAHDLSTLANSSASHGVFGFSLNTEISFLAQEVSAPRDTRTWETGLEGIHYVHALFVCSSRGISCWTLGQLDLFPDPAQVFMCSCFILFPWSQSGHPIIENLLIVNVQFTLEVFSILCYSTKSLLLN